jgi:uncharacterized integral membrane protein
MATARSRSRADHDDGRTHRPARQSTMRDVAEVAEGAVRRPAVVVGFALGLIIAAAVAVLVVQNGRSVPVSWVALEGDLPLWAVVLGSFAAGLVVAPLLYIGARWVRRRRHDRLAVIERARRTDEGRVALR